MLDLLRMILYCILFVHNLFVMYNNGVPCVTPTTLSILHLKLLYSSIN